MSAYLPQYWAAWCTSGSLWGYGWTVTCVTSLAGAVHTQAQVAWVDCSLEQCFPDIWVWLCIWHRLYGSSHHHAAMQFQFILNFAPPCDWPCSIDYDNIVTCNHTTLLEMYIGAIAVQIIYIMHHAPTAIIKWHCCWQWCKDSTQLYQISAASCPVLSNKSHYKLLVVLILAGTCTQALHPTGQYL